MRGNRQNADTPKSESKMSIVRTASALIAVAALHAPAMAAAPVVTPLWNNTPIFEGATTPVYNVTSTDTTFTIYYKPLTNPGVDSYNITVQVSVDGTNWVWLSTPWIAVNGRTGAGRVVSGTLSGMKFTKLRLIANKATDGASYQTSGSAWIVN